MLTHHGDIQTDLVIIDVNELGQLFLSNIDIFCRAMSQVYLIKMSLP